jgi:hypothetical protein
MVNRRYATTARKDLIPALKRRAKFGGTLRVEDLFGVSQSLYHEAQAKSLSITNVMTIAAARPKLSVSEAYDEACQYFAGKGSFNITLERLVADLKSHDIDYVVIGGVAFSLMDSDVSLITSILS